MAVKRKKIPEELEGIALVEDVNAIEEKLDKCYSKDRYKDFQADVEEIMGRYLSGKVWGLVALWIISILGSFLAQKFLNIF